MEKTVDCNMSIDEKNVIENLKENCLLEDIMKSVICFYDIRIYNKRKFSVSGT